jgi:hypothetical protein
MSSQTTSLASACMHFVLAKGAKRPEHCCIESIKEKRGIKSISVCGIV